MLEDRGEVASRTRSFGAAPPTHQGQEPTSAFEVTLPDPVAAPAQGQFQRGGQVGGAQPFVPVGGDPRAGPGGGRRGQQTGEQTAIGCEEDVGASAARDRGQGRRQAGAGFVGVDRQEFGIARRSLESVGSRASTPTSGRRISPIAGPPSAVAAGEGVVAVPGVGLVVLPIHHAIGAFDALVGAGQELGHLIVRPRLAWIHPLAPSLDLRGLFALDRHLAQVEALQVGAVDGHGTTLRPRQGPAQEPRARFRGVRPETAPLAAALVGRILRKAYPDPPIPLHHHSDFTLLVSVLLSAQCTDERVNQVTPLLWERLGDTPQKLALSDAEAIRAIIRPCGLSPSKSRAIHALSNLLLERHGGEVPRDFAALEALPGVGHKTASVVMSQAFGVPALPVDTHIHRCARRWGLSDGHSVERTEADLKALFPRSRWNLLHLQIIHFARARCPARGHDADQCPICSGLARKGLPVLP